MPLPALRFIAFIIGVFLITLAVSMVIPMLTLLLYDRSDDLGAFVWSSLIVLCAGLVMVARGAPGAPQLRARDMYLLTTASWVIVCAFAALPMVFIRHISYTDAFFETMSGITTTGSPGWTMHRPGCLSGGLCCTGWEASALSAWLSRSCPCCV